mgnify:FL=1
MIISAEDFLGTDDLDTREVDVPELGGSVLIRPLTIEEREKFEGWGDKSKGAKGKKTGNELLCQLVASSLVDESGERMFSDSDVPKLKKKSGALIDRLVKEIHALNGRDGEEEAGN